MDRSPKVNTLYQILLAEEEQNNQRQASHNAASVLHRRLIAVTGLLHRRRQAGKRKLGCNVRHKLRRVDREEQRDVEVIRPLPAEGEQEHRDHHGHGNGQNYLHEGAEGVGAVQICRLLQLIGHAAEELTQQEDVKSVLERML